MMRVNDALDEIRHVSYPATPGEIVDELDDPVLQLPNGEERLAEAFDRIDVDRLDCPEDATLSMLSALSEDAIGRKGYSDRDPPTESDRRIDQPTI